MPVFLLPLGLFALAALAIPLLVHLARRQTLVPTTFAALRWLRPRARPRRQVRLDEWPLLLLRLLLLTLFALWLAQPAVQRDAPPEHWVMLAPGIDPQALPAPAEGGTRRWLVPGWPVVGDGPAPAADATGVGHGLGTLLRQLDMALPAGASLVVQVPDPLAGADAQRPRLSRDVDWQVVPAAGAGRRGDGGGRSNGESATAVRGAGSVPQLAIRHDAAHAAGVRYLRAVAQAWQGDPAGTPATGTADGAAETPRANPAARATDPAGAIWRHGVRDGDVAVDVAEIIDAGAVVDADVPGRDPAHPATVLAWLVAGPVPGAVQAFVAEGGTALLSVDADWPGLEDAPSAWEAEGVVRATGMRHGRGRVVRFAQPLDPALWPGLLEADVPHALRRVLHAPPAPARVPAADYAPVHGAPAWPIGWQDLRAPLLWMILIVLLAERWLATARRRGVAP